MAEKFFECKSLFQKYESRGDAQAIEAHVLGDVYGKLYEFQQDMQNEVNGLTDYIQDHVLQPLNSYQKEITTVRDNRKDLKDTYDKIEQYKQSLDKARKDMENLQKTGQSSRLTMIGNNDATKRVNDLYKLEEKVAKSGRDLEEATISANEKYDKYTEGLYKRISEECELTRYYLDYLKRQKNYHKQALKRLEVLIPEVKESLNKYNKKPVFGCPLGEYVSMSQGSRSVRSLPSDQQLVSPVIRSLIDGMCKQGVFSEEGIFRIAGSRIKMNCLIHAIDAGYLEFIDLNNDFDVHCLAGVLKQYIRELPDSILCNELYENWLNAVK